MSIKTTVGQVAMVGGDQSDRPSGILVDERALRSGKWQRRGNLYALVEVAGPVAGRDVLARQLLDTVRNAYFAWQGSVTAGLQQAIREANALLFRENRDSLPGEQRTAGVSCLVVRENDLFLAQAGPSAVYLTRGDQVTRLPELSPWLDDVALEDVDAAPLGARSELSAALFHALVGPGDVALLTESALARRLPAWELPGMLAQATTGEILGALVIAGGGSNLSALVVRLEEATAPSVRSVAPGSLQEELEAAPPPVSRPLRPGLFAMIGRVRFGQRAQAAGRTLSGVLAALGAGLLTLLKRVLPGQVAPVENKPAKGAPARPSRTQEPVKGVPKRSAQSKAFIWLAVGVPLLVAAVVLVLVVQRNQTQRAEIQALWDKANQSWLEGSGTNDKTVARGRLGEALSTLEQLVARRPEHQEAGDLQNRVRARLDEINQVQRVAQFTTLKTYSNAARLSRVIVEDEHIFVLDRNSGTVVHHQLIPGQQALDPAVPDAVVVSKGDQVGDVLVGDLVDMAWITAGQGRQRAGLGILDSGGALLEYDPVTQKVTASRIKDYETWQFAKLIGTYFGRLYVLDSSASKIWRYAPTVDGYSASPDDWLSVPADLTGSLDMAIGDSIFVLSVDGSIRRYTTGEADAFAVSDWDVPPNNPGALFTRPPEAQEPANPLYIADRGNSRIVRTSPEGTFQQQVRTAISLTGPDPLASVTSLSVDTTGKQVLFLSGDKLYMFVLP